MFRYRNRFRNLLEIPTLSEVNKVFKDNPIFISYLLYFVPIPPYILTPPPPPFNNFSKFLKLPLVFKFDPSVYYENKGKGPCHSESL